MPLPNQVPQWKDWSEEDRTKYRGIEAMVKAGIRVSQEDFSWFTFRRRNLRFYARIRGSFYRRCHNRNLNPRVGPTLSKGFNTCTR